MKLTIDTQHDTLDDIKRVIRVLSEVIHTKNGAVLSNKPIVEQKEPSVDTTNMMDMFGNASSTESQEREPNVSEGKPMDFSGFMQLVNKKNEDKSDDSKIISY
ncbi:MAG: hypothetical protein CMH61_02175 [Nanoarchaeota archaeon]|nr:hypothetical protein [Nanoarchaeota archaeon]